MRSAAPRITTAAEGLPRRRFTVAEVKAMVAAGVMEEDEHVELNGGELVQVFPELVPMSPKGRHPRVVKSSLVDRWIRGRPEDCRLTQETTFRLSEDTYLEPDIVVYPRAIGLKGLTGTNVLLVVEIADSSLRYDMGRKATLYASFGVRQLWVIDAVRLTARLYRIPAAGGYQEASDHVATDRLEPRFAPDAFALRLDELDLS
jgi:Uma2 family endonuclease